MSRRRRLPEPPEPVMVPVKFTDATPIEKPKRRPRAGRRSSPGQVQLWRRERKEREPERLTSRGLLPQLLRDARPTRREIEDEPDARKRQDQKRARDSVIYELIKAGQTRMLRGERLGALDLCRIRNFCKDLGAARNRKRGLPKPNGGRPKESPARLRLAVAIWEAFETNRKKPKSEREKASSVLKKVAHRLRKKISYVREVYYSILGSDRDPEWLRAVKAELFFSKENAEIAASRAEIKRGRDETEIARLATLLPSEYAQQRETASKALGMRPAALDIEVKRAQKRKSEDFKALRGTVLT
jgi:hypothetical protein